ncbi:MAG: hypothetical protein ACOC5T_06455 [Elusimicrobiota bacterium]
MKAINLREKINELLCHPELFIDQETLQNVCKIHQGEMSCRYIMLTPNGFMCCKNTNIAKTLDKLKQMRYMKASSDNCDGLKKS